MKLEGAVRSVRRVRIATSAGVALALMIMGVASLDSDMSEAAHDGLFLLAGVLIILSVIIPISYTVYLAKKGPDDDENE